MVSNTYDKKFPLVFSFDAWHQLNYKKDELYCSEARMKSANSEVDLK